MNKDDEKTLCMACPLCGGGFVTLDITDSSKPATVVPDPIIALDLHSDRVNARHILYVCKRCYEVWT